MTMTTPLTTPASRAESATMTVTLLYVDHCHNWPLAAERLRAALSAAELPHVRMEWRPVHHAAAAGFAGSPTILIDGIDPFPRPVAGVGLCCRFYDTDHGSDGAPSVAQLDAALRAAWARRRP